MNVPGINDAGSPPSVQTKVNYPTYELSTNPHYPRWVDVGGEPRQCHQCVADTTAKGMIFRARPDCPVCHGIGTLSTRVMAQNHKHHSSLVGKEIGPNARPVKPEPPTVEEVMAQGTYSLEAAQKIVAREKALEAAGYEPYGDKVFDPMAMSQSAGGQTPTPPAPVVPPAPAVTPETPDNGWDGNI